METKTDVRPEKCPSCGSAKMYKGRIIPRKRLGVRQRRWVCSACGTSTY